MLCKVGETQAKTYKNQSLRGLQVIFTNVHTTADTAFANHAIDFTQVTISVILKRAGKSYTIAQDQLMPLILASNFKKPSWHYSHPLRNTNFIELREKALGVDHKIMIPTEIDFGGPINLKNDDELRAKITYHAGAAGATISAAESYVEVYPVADIGNEETIPAIVTESIQTGQTRTDISIGDNVKEVFFINTNKSSRLESVNVIDELNFKSDKLVRDLNYNQLILQTVKQLQYIDDASSRFQSFCVAEQFDYEMNNVQLTISLDSTQVTAGKNWVVAYKSIPDRETLARAIARERRHSEENEAALLAQI